MEDKIVTKETCAEWLSKSADCVPFHIEGIPEGFTFFRDFKKYSDSNMKLGFLIGFTPGYKFSTMGACYQKSVTVGANASQEEIDKKIKSQSIEMVKLYKENLKNK